MTNRNLALIIKEQNPLMLAGKETVQHACQRMWDRRVGAVLVTDDNSHLVGIFTGRDAVRTLAEGKNPAETTLAASMTPNPTTIAPDRNAIDALRKMTDGGYRHLPVAANGRILGIVSRGDFTGLELDRLEDEGDIWDRIM